jgi:hypothetical protein
MVVLTVPVKIAPSVDNNRVMVALKIWGAVHQSSGTDDFFNT